MAENFNWSNIVNQSKSLGLNLNAGINANINQGYSQSGSSGGSVNSAESFNNSFNMSEEEAWAHAYSQTDAMTARMWSALMAEDAWNKSMQAFHEQMDFNREEAQKQRDWQAEMANTIYTRSIKNMKEAGINPILAANMGLSGASVGTGATASLGGSPSAPLAQNFMDSWSGSDSYSHGYSYGESYGSGYENGSGWNAGWSNSEEGIVTALQGLGQLASGAISGINAGSIVQKISGKGNEMANGIVKGATKAVEAINQGIRTVTGNQQNNNGAPSKSNTKNPYIRNIGSGTLRKK